MMTNPPNSSNSPHPAAKFDWRRIVAPYERPDRWRSNWQLINTLVPYALVWAAMIWSLQVSYWLTLALAVIGAGLLVRTFILFHDCGHGSFFKSRRANTFWGYLLGVLTFTPNYLWWHEHAEHHAGAGDLGQRGVGDVWTMTVKEYLAASRSTRFQYRLVRNPICLFLIAPSILFLIVHRFALNGAKERARRSVVMTNLGILAVAVVLGGMIGFKAYFMIQLPIIMIAASMGVWMFYVQHQFEDTYWDVKPQWDYYKEAMEGSSFYKLPRVLQWFTGNIGFHHIHHLSPRIPNYFLERCYKENPLFQKIQPITFWSSLQSLKFRLWDEQNRQLISFAEMEKRLLAGLIRV